MHVEDKSHVISLATNNHDALSVMDSIHCQSCACQCLAGADYFIRMFLRRLKFEVAARYYTYETAAGHRYSPDTHSVQPRHAYSSWIEHGID